jgi:hypothetical protein
MRVAVAEVADQLCRRAKSGANVGGIGGSQIGDIRSDFVAARDEVSLDRTSPYGSPLRLPVVARDGSRPNNSYHRAETMEPL